MRVGDVTEIFHIAYEQRWKNLHKVPEKSQPAKYLVS